MTDICKCRGEGCSLKESCWRFLAPFEKWQSMMETPEETGEKCEYYWPAKQHERDSTNNH